VLASRVVTSGDAMKRAFVMLAAVVMLSVPAAQAAVVFNEGDFSAWTFGSYAVGGGTATMTREAAGGNPGARLNVTTVTNSLAQSAFGTGIKSDFSTSTALAGTGFTVILDVLSGAGAFGQGQAVQLLVEQGGAVYAYPLGITSVQAAFTSLAFTGVFNAASFTLVSGSGPATPNFSGGVVTRFGIAAGNTNSATLTQYYDNVRLDLAVVGAAASTADIPTLSTWALIATILLLVTLASRRLRGHR